ncbi:CmcI family methyltransferase [Pendulispora albinea]|uniref:Rhamnosyl O-methyltransferase n=1 Tax=Pendulispora albinea TaxID=2741071 RepID=A0ABZ2LSS6_9BACT
MSNNVFHGRNYFERMKEHYPAEVVGDRLSDAVLTEWMRSSEFGVDPPNRFQRLTERPFSMQQHAWLASRAVQGGAPWLHRLSASRAYKGLLNLKSPFDLVLYSNLIWELQPRTIIEFGAFQGGSGLWFADQLTASDIDGEVHSFEMFDACIHPSASHPRLRFHHADLRDVNQLDKELFAALPHPWLVVDDAHVNVAGLATFVNGYMAPGDYYVLEDIFLLANFEIINQAVLLAEGLGFLVDTKYTDAFGMNVTCSPNGWLRKS